VNTFVGWNEIPFYNIVYIDWGAGEPNDSGDHEDCAMLYKAKGWTWNDSVCNNRYSHICEIEYV